MQFRAGVRRPLEGQRYRRAIALDSQRQGERGVSDRFATSKTVSATYRVELKRRSLLAQQKPYIANFVFKGQFDADSKFFVNLLVQTNLSNRQ